jgi:hypothetical protein
MQLVHHLYAAALTALACANAVHAQLYDVLTTPASGLVGSIDLEANTSGTLIGDWTNDTNPTGTRTKPGTFGSFGPTENVAVPTSLGLGLGGNLNSRTDASFQLNLNPGAGTASLSNYSANFLADGPIDLPAEISIAFDTFRTRNPDSLFPGLPITLPFGNLQLATLSATQTGPSTVGTLTPAGGNTYDLTLLTPVSLSASFEGLGQMFDIGYIPFLLPLQGQVTITGDTLSLLATTPLDLASSFDPGVALPEFPLPLPTILPPGDTANLLFNLMLDEIGFELLGTITLDARGTLVPAPSAMLIFISSGLPARPGCVVAIDDVDERLAHVGDLRQQRLLDALKVAAHDPQLAGPRVASILIHPVRSTNSGVRNSSMKFTSL